MDRVIIVLFSVFVSTTLNREKTEGRREKSEEIRKKIIARYGQGRGYKSIPQQLDAPITAVANII